MAIETIQRIENFNLSKLEHLSVVLQTLQLTR